MTPSSSSYRRLCVGLIVVVAGPAVLPLQRFCNDSGCLCCADAAAAAAWSLSPHNVVVTAPVHCRRRRCRTIQTVAPVPVFLSAARTNDDSDDVDGSVDDEEDENGRKHGRRSRKFTGRSLRFDNEATTAKDEDVAAVARNIVPYYEREMNLASRFEQTLPVQALLLAMAIAFVAYVGLSGGITDGSNRYFFDDNDPPSSWTTLPYPNDDFATTTTTTTDSVYI